MAQGGLALVRGGGMTAEETKYARLEGKGDFLWTRTQASERRAKKPPSNIASTIH